MEASLQTVKRRKATWIGHIWRTNCLLKHVIEGQIEGRENEERKQTATGWPWGKERILEIGRGNTRSHCLENSLWKRQSTCHKTDYRNNEDTLMSQFRRACALFESFSRDGHIVNRLGYLSSQINGAFFFSLSCVSFFWFCPPNARQMFKKVEHCFLRTVWRWLVRKSTDDSMRSGGNIFSIVDTVILTERRTLKRRCCHLVVLS